MKAKAYFTAPFRFIRRHVSRRQVAWIVGLALAFLIITPVITYAYYAHDISDRDRLMNRNSTGVVLRDRNGEVFYKLGQMQDGTDVALADVADVFERSVVASEDRNFYVHDGYSLRGIAVALYSNVQDKDATRYGGSTITQQLVKNKLLTSDKNYLRKYQEVSLAVAIERKYTKDEILEMYINSVYFGEGAFGIADAAKTYFGKHPRDLSLAESSMLVGLLPAPSAYSPVSGDAAAAKKQQGRVLDSMVEAGVISQGEKDAALAQELAYSQVAAEDSNVHARHFAMMVLDDLEQKYGEEAVVRSGYDVTTSLDLDWQKAAEAQVRAQVSRLAGGGARNAGLVAIDPRSGQVRALVGSVDWNDPTFGKVNMALSARQPGSSFKPIYYAEALERQLITPATLLDDQPKTYGGTYKPANYDFRYRGKVTTRTALALSLNLPAVEVMQQLGVDDASQAARRFGISTVTEPQKYGLSLALGTAETKLYEMTNAYAAFANKGQQYQPVTVLSIRDKLDRETFEAGPGSARRVISAETAYLMSSMLADNQARAATFGSSLTVPGRQVAVKTGTTNDNKDAWTIGYTPSLAIGVWMGNNENQPMRGLAGSSSAGIVWRNTMTELAKSTANETFTKPAGVISMRVCSTANAGGYEEVFLQGTQPKDSCATKREEPEQKPGTEKKQEEETETKPDETEETPDEEPLPEDEQPADEEPVVTDPGDTTGEEPADGPVIEPVRPRQQPSPAESTD